MPHAPQADLVILASGSTGNCAALVLGDGNDRALWLIDAGLSPRRTLGLLVSCGLAQDALDARARIAGIVLTHLDADHWHAGWAGKLDPRWRVFVHRRHRGRADRAGALYGARVELLEDEPAPLASDAMTGPPLLLHPSLHAHDDLGAMTLRLETPDRQRILGFATDVGCISDALVAHLAGVGVLAVESNYCPRMELASDRPDFLKRRIMGGAGHLSNEQSADLVRQTRPTRHVVLLHLSQQCNSPHIALAHHGHGLPVLVARPDEPLPPIPIHRAAWNTPAAGPSVPSRGVPSRGCAVARPATAEVVTLWDGLPEKTAKNA